MPSTRSTTHLAGICFANAKGEEGEYARATIPMWDTLNLNFFNTHYSRSVAQSTNHEQGVEGPGTQYGGWQQRCKRESTAL